MKFRTFLVAVLTSLGVCAVAIGMAWLAATPLNYAKPSLTKYHHERLKDDATNRVR